VLNPNTFAILTVEDATKLRNFLLARFGLEGTFPRRVDYEGLQTVGLMNLYNELDEFLMTNSRLSQFDPSDYERQTY
jgi:hypothetical protein